MADHPLPYQDPTLSVEQRVDDLLDRMELVDKAGLMFHDMVGMGPAGQLAGPGNQVSRPPTADVIQRQRINHFNLVGGVANVRDLVAWHNAVQELGTGDAARHPRHPVHRPAALLHRQPRHRVPGRRLLGVARDPRPRRPGRSRRWSSTSPTSPARSTSPSGSGSPCTRRSTWPPSRAGRGSGRPSARTPS